MLLETEEMSLPQNILKGTAVYGALLDLPQTVWIWDFLIAHSEISDLPTGHLDCLGVKVE